MWCWLPDLLEDTWDMRNVVSLLQKWDIPCMWVSNVTGYVWPFVYVHIEPDEMCHVCCLLVHGCSFKFVFYHLKSDGHFYTSWHSVLLCGTHNKPKTPRARLGRVSCIPMRDRRFIKGINLKNPQNSILCLVRCSCTHTTVKHVFTHTHTHTHTHTNRVYHRMEPPRLLLPSSPPNFTMTKYKLLAPQLLPLRLGLLRRPRRCCLFYCHSKICVVQSIRPYDLKIYWLPRCVLYQQHAAQTEVDCMFCVMSFAFAVSIKCWLWLAFTTDASAPEPFVCVVEIS